MSLAFLSCQWTTDGPRMMQRQAASSDGHAQAPAQCGFGLMNPTEKNANPTCLLISGKPSLCFSMMLACQGKHVLYMQV